MITDLGSLVRDYLVEQCTVIIDAEPELRRRGPVVHDTRVAVRRLRSTLRVFEDLLDPARAGAVADELAWWAGELGVVRDLEVLQERVLAHLDELPAELVLGPVRAQLSEAIQLRRHDGWDEIAAVLDTDRHRQLIAEVRRWRSDPPFTASAQRPAGHVKAYLKRADRLVRRRLRHAREALAAGDPGADDLLHRARKAGKRHRYAVELAQPVLGAKAEATIAARKQLQDVLGDHQDGVVAAAFLRAEGARLGSRTGHNGFTYGLLYARERELAATLSGRLQSTRQTSRLCAHSLTRPGDQGHCPIGRHAARLEA